MNVADIMTTNPTTVGLDTTLGRALDVMQHVGCRHLPIMSRDGHLVGILSDRDCRTAMNSPHVLRERWQDEELSDKLTVRSAMTAAPIITEANVSARQAARLMLENHIGCLPVMRGETLIGIITTSDILMAFVHVSRVPA